MGYLQHGVVRMGLGMIWLTVAYALLTPPASQQDVELCKRLHQFLTETNQHDGEVVRYKRNDGTQIDCGTAAGSIPKIEVRS